MTSKTQARLTYQDYFDLPESDDRYELIDGELYMAPGPIPEHQLFLYYLAKAIEEFATRHGLGITLIAPLDVVLSDADVFQPDIVFVSNERRSIIRKGLNVQGAPDLVVEVLSPSTAQRDRTLKRERYARFGVREYWIADIVGGTVEVNVSSGDKFEVVGMYGEGDIFESPLLPGLEVDVNSVFESARI